MSDRAVRRRERREAERGVASAQAPLNATQLAVLTDSDEFLAAANAVAAQFRDNWLNANEGQVELSKLRRFLDGLRNARDNSAELLRGFIARYTTGRARGRNDPDLWALFNALKELPEQAHPAFCQSFSAEIMRLVAAASPPDAS